MTSEGTFASVTDAARALRAGEATSVALTETALAAARSLDDRLGVYVTRFDAAARAAAERADGELARGVDRGPLHGIPVGVKDTIADADGPTTAQSLVLDPDWAGDRDAVVVARLKAAGAVITGKTTTMEFGCGLPDPDKPFPVPRNPWDETRWTGGSSSGTASGIAAGMFLAGLGSDTAGSIRMPSAFCGVTGLMPTYGRVPERGCLPLAYSVDRIGPLARTARDCALLLDVLCGSAYGGDSGDAAGGADASGRTGSPLSGVRVGVVRAEHFPAAGDPALGGAFEGAVGLLRELGATTVELTLPYWRELITAAIVTAVSEGLAHHRTALSARWRDYTVAARGLLASGALVTASDYVQAQRVRRVAQAALDEVFGGVDVIACPTAAVGAPRLDELANEAGHQDNDRLFGLLHTPYWNGVANPVLALPMGRTADGRPLSMQLAGAPFDEATVLRVAEAYQRYSDWHRRLPPGGGEPAPSGPVPSGPAPSGPVPTAVRQRVAALLAAAELPADDAEVRGLAAAYAGQRAAADALYEVPMSRELGPVRPDPAAVRRNVS